jgi:hypothetical protein
VGDKGASYIKAFCRLSVLLPWTNSDRQREPVKGKPLERVGRKATSLRLAQARYGSRAAGHAHPPLGCVMVHGFLARLSGLSPERFLLLSLPLSVILESPLVGVIH